MAFFDELTKKAQTYAGVAVDKAKDLAGAASEKAKEVADSAKINMAILSEQRELDKNYKAIGEWFVAEYGEDIPDAVKDVVEAVNASKAKIAELEASKPQKDEEEEPVMPAAVPDKSSGPAGGSSGAFRTSRAAYADINRQLGSFYEDTAGETGEEREMQARIEELERRLEEQQAQKTAQEEQVALLEKSYEIAARYMNGGQAPEAPRQKASVSGKASVQPVRQVRRNIVSLLAAPLPDSVFAREFVKPRNWGFNTVGSDLREPERNSIRAAVQQTVTLTDGGEVTFRLLEPMMAGELLIPSGTPVTGAARINGERLTVKVSAVQHGGAVVPVDLSVYDTNGNEGIPVPGSEELNAVKEIAANMGAGMGSSITITDDAGSQLLSDLGRSAIQGVSQYVSKKMRSVKVTLKAGYSVLLLPPLQ